MNSFPFLISISHFPFLISCSWFYNHPAMLTWWFVTWKAACHLEVMAEALTRDIDRIQACVTQVAGLLGYTSLKVEQRLCLAEFISGRDVFVVLPTGFGKTACFTTLPFAFDLVQERDLENRAIIIVVSLLTPLL